MTERRTRRRRRCGDRRPAGRWTPTDIAAGDDAVDVDSSDDIIEEEAPLEEPVAERFSDNGDHLPEIDAIEVVPDAYAEGDEVADEAAALGVEITDEAELDAFSDSAASSDDAIVLDATTAASEDRR